MIDAIPLVQCVDRKIYKIFSRNLRSGVFVGGTSGFIGIRCKFDSLRLDMEYHRDKGPPFGTVAPLEIIGEVPAGIELKTSLGAIDQVTGKAVLFDRPVVDGGMGWYFVDDGKPSEAIHPVGVENKPLFELLKQYDYDQPGER